MRSFYVNLRFAVAASGAGHFETGISEVLYTTLSGLTRMKILIFKFRSKVNYAARARNSCLVKKRKAKNISTKYNTFEKFINSPMCQFT